MAEPGRSRRNDLESEIRIGWRMGGLGMEVAGAVVAGALLGWGFDHLRGKAASTGLLVGSLMGIVVGMWSLIRGALKLNRLLDRHHPTAGRGKPLPPEEEDGDDDWNTGGRGDRQGPTP